MKTNSKTKGAALRGFTIAGALVTLWIMVMELRGAVVALGGALAVLSLLGCRALEWIDEKEKGGRP